MVSGPSSDVIATWIGALTGGGVLFSEDEERGVRAAILLVGEARLAELRTWFQHQDGQRRQEIRYAALTLAMLVLVADRALPIEEQELFDRLLDAAQLPERDRARARELLGHATRDPRKLPHPETIAEALDHDALRELMLGMAWHVALIDGRIELGEDALYVRLARLFGVDDEVAARIREIVAAYR